MGTTEEKISADLVAATAKAKKAVLRERELRKRLVTAQRRRRNQKLFAVGAAVFLAVEANPGHLSAVRALILPFITRPTDRAALDGTAFAFERGAAE